MTWAKLSDDFTDDCWVLSDAALRLHVDGLCWNGRKLLDLRLPAEEVRRFSKRPEAVGELLDGGWWAEEGGFLVIKHHGSYQRTREAVINQQAANSTNGKKGGRPPEAGRERASETRSVSESVSGSKSERDRPGQVGTGSALPQPKQDFDPGDPWADVVVAIPGQPALGRTS